MDVNNGTEINGKLSNAELASQVINKYTGNSSNPGTKRKVTAVIKNDDEYNRKRARNNVAVKKSREKAKNRIQETQSRVEQLSDENEELQTKVTLLSKELNVLRALFTNGGFSLPGDLPYLNNSNNNTTTEHHLPHSPDSIGSHSGNTSHLYEPPVHHSISQLHTSNKSNYLKPEDPKIPPLRPMPRIINSSTSKNITQPDTVKSYSYNNSNERESVFTFSHKTPSYYKKEMKVSPPLNTPSILIPPHSHVSTSSPTYSSYSSTQSSINFPYKKMYETNHHTSVIRNGPKVIEQNNSSALQTLGKFCIVSDPENNDQVKIVPI